MDHLRVEDINRNRSSSSPYEVEECYDRLSTSSVRSHNNYTNVSINECYDRLHSNSANEDTFDLVASGIYETADNDSRATKIDKSKVGENYEEISVNGGYVHHPSFLQLLSYDNIGVSTDSSVRKAKTDESERNEMHRQHSKDSYASIELPQMKQVEPREVELKVKENRCGRPMFMRALIVLTMVLFAGLIGMYVLYDQNRHAMAQREQVVKLCTLCIFN